MTPADALRDYLAAGERGDFDTVIGFYSEDLQVVRIAADGAVTTQGRDHLVAGLRQVQAAGQVMPPATDLVVVHESAETVWFRRIKNGQPAWYEFVFDLTAPQPRLTREVVLAAPSGVQPVEGHPGHGG